AVEVRHDSFRCPDFVAMAREHGVAIVLAGDSKYPEIADATADFVYVRAMGTTSSESLGYPRSGLDLWARRATYWALGKPPPKLKPVVAGGPVPVARDVFLYVIGGHKAHNPAAAMALIKRSGGK